MNVNELFPSRFLKYTDLKGREVTLTIASVSMEDIGMGAQKTRKAIVRFEGTTKGLVLNKANAALIEALYGAETSAWVGQRITLCPATTQFQGKDTPCVRVRPTKPGAVDAFAAKAAPPPPAAEDELFA